jgi:hypothetical protein
MTARSTSRQSPISNLCNQRPLAEVDSVGRISHTDGYGRDVTLQNDAMRQRILPYTWKRSSRNPRSPRNRGGPPRTSRELAPSPPPWACPAAPTDGQVPAGMPWPAPASAWCIAYKPVAGVTVTCPKSGGVVIDSPAKLTQVKHHGAVRRGRPHVGVPTTARNDLEVAGSSECHRLLHVRRRCRG